jgi:DNA-binding response OmpR family regulator
LSLPSTSTARRAPLELAFVPRGVEEPVLGFYSFSPLTPGGWIDLLDDLGLPATLRRLKSARPDLPVIVVSSMFGESVAAAAMKAGADDFVARGFLARLPAAVDREMRAASARKWEPIGRFADGAALDFDELLSGIAGHTKALLALVGSRDSVREHLEEISRAAERASALADQLLVLSGRPRPTREATAPGPAVPLVSEETPSLPIPAGSETVLLVEEEVGVRGLCRKLLEAHGYYVLDASGGEQAVELATRFPGPIDLLLTDVVMPGSDGSRVAERVRQIRPEARVLFLSGESDAAPARTFADTSLIQMPFTPQALALRVREALAG